MVCLTRLAPAGLERSTTIRLLPSSSKRYTRHRSMRRLRVLEVLKEHWCLRPCRTRFLYDHEYLCDPQIALRIKAGLPARGGKEEGGRGKERGGRQSAEDMGSR